MSKTEKELLFEKFEELVNTIGISKFSHFDAFVEGYRLAKSGVELKSNRPEGLTLFDSFTMYYTNSTSIVEVEHDVKMSLQHTLSLINLTFDKDKFIIEIDKPIFTISGNRQFPVRVWRKP